MISQPKHTLERGCTGGKCSGHTVPTRGVPVGPSGQRFSALLVHAEPPGAPLIKYPLYRNQPVRPHWLIPITEGEREIAMKDGSETLVERLWESGASWIHRDRAPLA